MGVAWAQVAPCTEVERLAEEVVECRMHCCSRCRQYCWGTYTGYTLASHPPGLSCCRPPPSSSSLQEEEEGAGDASLDMRLCGALA
jgi:hypothetical protein